MACPGGGSVGKEQKPWNYVSPASQKKREKAKVAAVAAEEKAKQASHDRWWGGLTATEKIKNTDKAFESSFSGSGINISKRIDIGQDRIAFAFKKERFTNDKRPVTEKLLSDYKNFI